MLFDPNPEELLGRLEDELRRAETITPELMSDVIGQACVRFAAHRPHVNANVHQLIEVGAWTDATLAMLELELPQWKLRRLVRDDGEWFCSLSKQPELPIGYDEVAEASHEILPLAILLAFVQARRTTAASAKCLTTVPQVRPVEEHASCCDNFA